MKAKTGYIRLGDAATFINGFAFKPDHWGDSGLPIIRIQNLNNEMAEFNYYNGPIPNKYVVHDGDILISWSASLGAYEWKRGEALLNQHIFKAVFDKVPINKYFLRYAVLGNLAKMEKDAHGATMRHIVKKDFDNTLIPYPPIEEQQRIVDELDLLSSIIKKKTAQLRDLDALAQSIFYELFGDPSAAFYGRSDSALRIGDFSKCIAGATPSTKVNSYWSNGTIPWLSSGEVAKGRVFATDTMISQEGYDSCSTRLVPKNSVLIAMAGQGKTRGSVGISGIELCTNQSICSIIVNDKIILPDYLYYELKLLYNELRSISNGDGGRGGLNLKLIQGFSVIVPDIDEQMTFVKRAKAIETQKTLIQDSLIQAKKLLDSRMSYYFG